MEIATSGNWYWNAGIFASLGIVRILYASWNEVNIVSGNGLALSVRYQAIFRTSGDLLVLSVGPLLTNFRWKKNVFREHVL